MVRPFCKVRVSVPVRVKVPLEIVDGLFAQLLQVEAESNVKVIFPFKVLLPIVQLL